MSRRFCNHDQLDEYGACVRCGRVPQPRYACSYCHLDEMPDGEIALEQRDPHGIYAGRWHETCWQQHGYGNFKFDAAYAGERLEEEDY